MVLGCFLFPWLDSALDYLVSLSRLESVEKDLQAVMSADMMDKIAPACFELLCLQSGEWPFLGRHPPQSKKGKARNRSRYVQNHDMVLRLF